MGQKGTPVILMHGFLGSGSNLMKLANALSKDRVVFLVDLRNHGNSPHDEVMGYEVMAKDVYELCLLEKINKVQLLGHSMGGKVAMLFTHLFPEKVDRFVVEDIAPKKYKESYRPLIKALFQINLKNLKTREQANQLLSHTISNKMLCSFLLKNLSFSKSKKHFIGNVTLLLLIVFWICWLIFQ